MQIFGINKAFVIAIIFFGLFPELHSFECEKHEWVLSGIRSQGGGWIWFLGDAVDDKSDRAYSMAEGQALDRLVSECGAIHKEVKFHERCDFPDKDKKIHAYARASIKDSQCSEMKYSEKREKITNEKLTQLYLEYKKALKKQYSYKGCNQNEFNSCHEISKLIWDKDNENAVQISDYGCSNKNYQSCFLLSWNFFSKKDDSYKRYVELGCDLSSAGKCYSYGKVELEKGNGDFAKYFFDYACALRDGEACTLAGELETKDINKKISLFYSGCELSNIGACKKGLEISTENNNEQMKSKFLNTGCDDGHIDEFCKKLNKKESGQRFINDKSDNSIQMLRL
ncbi:MAG: hypothetical protein HQK52_19575 [Oligoflexia bacterium]|nr:hypothetical protein [Oligoflexia bacterium]